MSTNKSKNYSIQDAFKSLDMLEEEEVLSVEEEMQTKRILTENTITDEQVSTEVETINHDEIDAEIEEFNKNLRRLKEKYDRNSKTLSENELKQLKDAGILETSESAVENIITEEQKINVADKKQVEQELDNINKENNEEEIEMVVDVEAETVDELKSSYMGNYILQCPVCHTLIYKSEEDVIHSDDEDLVNVDEACPHCKSEDGFIIVGKVAPVTKENEEEDSEEDEEDKENEEETPEDDSENTEDVEKETKEESSENDEKDKTKNESVQSMPLELNFDDLNEELFNRLATKYLNNIYENVDSFETKTGSVDEDDSRVTLEGVINFKSGKKMDTKFVFEAKALTKKGRVRFIGMNESLSPSKKPFVLVGRIVEKVLMPESLTYNYSVRVDEELKRIYGRVVEDLSKIIKK